MEERKRLDDCNCNKKTAAKYVVGPHHDAGCPMHATEPPKAPERKERDESIETFFKTAKERKK